jgi:DNA-binding CsgD family transcriptional regulator
MQAAASSPNLTPRQRQVLDLLVKGYTNPQIADALGVSLDGAKWHVREIIGTLGVECREDAAEFWREYNGLPRRLRRFALAPFAIISGRLAAAVAGVAVAVPAVALVALVVGNQSGADDNPPAEADTARAASATATAPPSSSAVSVTSPTATQTAITDSQQLRVLRADPPTGDCDQVFSLTGERFDVGSEVEFHRWNGLDETVLLGAATGGREGTVELAGIELPEDCFPGAQYVYEVRPVGGAVAVESRAIFAVDQIGTITAVCHPTGGATVSGRGLPAETTLEVTWGEADPFTHVFAEVGRATVDETGNFSLAGSFPSTICGDENLAIYAHDSTGTLRARWKAPITPLP